MEENDEKIRIERILGLSVTSNAHFDCDSGLIAYPAGNTIVLLDIGSGTVVSHIVLETRKSVSALQLKGNSLLFVASDESNFLRVYNWQSGLVRDLSPCQNVICCAVSTALGILVTVGSDRVVSVWDFKGLTSNNNSSNSNANTPTRSSTPGSSNNNNRGRKLASSSVSCKVSCIYFSPEGNYFVTGGTRHLKFWYLQLGKNECVLTGRPAILGSEHSNADFHDVITDGVATYAIANFDGTISATLCQFDERRFLDKWVQLKTKQSFCMCMDDDLIFIGCADGLIRCFRAGKLDFVATLPLPHHLGVHIAAATDVTVLSSHPPVAKFPSVVAIGAPGGKKIVAVYADHSLYAWDVQDVKRVGLSHSWLWHSGCIWDISLGRQAILNSSHSNGSTSSSVYGWPSFITCSNDDTVRIWDITSQTKSNLYSNECLDIKYISTRYLDSPLFISHGNGVRCVGIGSSFLCCGDRQGNLRLWGNKMKNEVIKIKAHKEEILSIDVRGTLIATASRDGSVNLYNIGEEIERIASLQEHNGSVTSVKFIFLDRTTPPAFHVISCGADRSLVFRQLLPKKGTAEEFTSEKSFLTALQEGELTGNLEVQVISVVTSKTSLFDLETDASGKHVLVACQDACVRVYNISSGKHSKTLRNPAVVQPAPGTTLPTIIKIAIDPSGMYVASSSTAKTITVFDYYKGLVMANLLGHSELATALSFTPDLQNLLSVGGDSCVIVWALPREMVVTMEARMGEKRSRVPPALPPKLSQSIVVTSTTTPSPVSNPPSPVRADYRFSFGQLPDWAKKQMTGEGNTGSTIIKKPAVTLPQGKWSERVEQASGPMTIKSFYHSDTIVPVPFSKPQVNSKDTFTERNNEYLSRQNEAEDINSGDQSFEACDDSMKEITEKDQDEDINSSDFYSDVNKSTDGEFAEISRTQTSKVAAARSDTDTDESSTTRTSHSAPSKRIIAAYKDPRVVPYEIVRSRNAELIMSVKAKNREISKSRLELEKRLEDTRKKLQSIGYRSTSQSTQDLSHTFGNDYHDDSEENNDENGEIRRACSLSDLNVLPTLTKVAASSGRRKRSFSKHRKTKPVSTGGFDSQNIITRSTSMSALMVQLQQSDSEPESLPVQPSYMSKTISSQGKSRHKPPTVVSAYSQENLRDMGDDHLRVSASEQNIFMKVSGAGKLQSPMARSKMTAPTLKKPQQVYGITKGLAVVTGVRQGGKDEIPLSVEVASASVEALRKSLDQVINLKSRVSTEVVPDQEPITRILDDGLRSAQGLLYDSVIFQDSRPKIITEHEPTIL